MNQPVYLTLERQTPFRNNLFQWFIYNRKHGKHFRRTLLLLPVIPLMAMINYIVPLMIYGILGIGILMILDYPMLGFYLYLCVFIGGFFIIPSTVSFNDTHIQVYSFNIFKIKNKPVIIDFQSVHYLRVWHGLGFILYEEDYWDEFILFIPRNDEAINQFTKIWQENNPDKTFNFNTKVRIDM